MTWYIQSANHQICRGVAQSGSALEWGSRGRKFKSSRPDQQNVSLWGYQMEPHFTMGSRGQSPPEADKATLQGGLHASGVLVRLWRIQIPACLCVFGVGPWQPTIITVKEAQNRP